MIPGSVQSAVSKHLNCKINGFSAISGGCINEGGKLSTSQGDFFIKWNNKEQFPHLFEKEKAGIKTLSETKTIYLPEVVCAGEAEEWQYLILEFIVSTGHSTFYWKDLGRQLAELHHHKNSHFGLSYNNYIGSVVQNNMYHLTWPQFFENQRLRPLLKELEQAKRVDAKFIQSFERLYPRLGEIFPEEQPCLLHGDLWSGNVISDKRGMAYVIDPAIYYGHREAELAFTRLFGGFEIDFYESYEHHFPLEGGFDERMEVYHLYPLLVHAILFGDSYLQPVKRIINHFS